MVKGETEYDWAKRLMKNLFSDVESWNDDIDVVYEKADVWTVKKLLAIDWYLGPFYKIASKHFENIAYVDFFCGSGLNRFDNDKYSRKHLCKGSALIPLFVADKYPFSDYFFYDANSANVTALTKRIARLRREKIIDAKVTIHEPECRTFAESSNLLFGQNGLLKKRPLSLVIIDPNGHCEVTWNQVENILRNGKVDMIMTFMTSGLVRNRGKALKDVTGQDAMTLNAFFGDSGWQRLESADEILAHYCNKIRGLGYHVRTISVNDKGKRRIYDIIFASKNRSVIDRIFADLQEKMQKLTTELLAVGIGVNQKEFYDLASFMGG
jgi:three-Cys-motif partner protein